MEPSWMFFEVDSCLLQVCLFDREGRLQRLRLGGNKVDGVLEVLNALPLVQDVAFFRFNFRVGCGVPFPH